MATTLNVTVNGIKFTADTSQELALQVNGVTAMTVNASQVVSFANPPSINGAGSIATVGKAIAMAIVFGG